MPFAPHAMNRALIATVVSLGLAGFAAQASAAKDEQAAAAERTAKAVAHWTKERREAAIPRDLRIDSRGYGYLRKADGKLVPHGHTVAALAKEQGGPSTQAKPVADTAGPIVSAMDPANGSTIGTSKVFSAKVTDKSGVRSVVFRITPPGGSSQDISAVKGASDVWSSSLSGFNPGSGNWRVLARDLVGATGNLTTSALANFTVSTGGGGGVVANAHYTAGGDIKTAAGRIYFEMPSNSRWTRWAGYVCSGTVTNDGTSGRSIVITAAHCVFDDAYKAFARNVLFIPDQDSTTGTGTDTNCGNDPLGCWSPAFGVVDTNWTTRTFPANVAWDYAFYVFNDAGSHSGNGGGASLVLETAAKGLTPSFNEPAHEVSGSTDYTHGLGYSYSDDPNFMYCAEDMETEDPSVPVNWWLPSCDLSGGSSGGPWVQPFSGGTGPIISVNSWGYTSSPGMAGPKLNGNSATCVFTRAKSTAFGSVPTTDGNEGVKDSSCP